MFYPVLMYLALSAIINKQEVLKAVLHDAYNYRHYPF